MDWSTHNSKQLSFLAQRHPGYGSLANYIAKLIQHTVFLILSKISSQEKKQEKEKKCLTQLGRAHLARGGLAAAGGPSGWLDLGAPAGPRGAGRAHAGGRRPAGSLPSGCWW